MGWLYDGVPDEQHEGYPVGVLPNGVIPTYTTGNQWFEMEFRDGWWSTGTAAEDPGTDPAWLQPTCVCGWRGARVPHAPQSPDAAEAEARTQWNAHMDEVTVYLLTTAKAAESLITALDLARTDGEFDSRPLAVINALRTTQSHIATHITTAVAAARAQDLSWELIGTALGVTRQTAHERYREVVPSPARQQA
ncbi:MAG TPA: hypothetical protein VL551_24840 [Actinospica sp.]|jgi:hypothetical protein|nr:hypothetical protein [Actinospica sp.]